MRMRIRNLEIAICVSFGLALLFVSRGQSGTRAQAQQRSDQQFEKLIHSVEGPDLFRAYCASCHGTDGKGHGPAASALKANIPDLTLLAAINGGQFPTRRVRSAITGEDALASHGSRDMPIWGPVFHQIEADVDRGNVRVENLVNYIQSIQSIPSPQENSGKKASAQNVPSGAQLYKQYCADCHANDLKGNGPAPYPFKDYPPDLTTLARRHGGKFPDEYVIDVLRHGVPIPAHGPAEMPIWGMDFRAGGQADEAQVTLRITSLKDYIKSRQVK